MAGASTGSIYHHFGSKEQIAASLYLEGVRQSQEAGVEALLRCRTGRTGVAAQVAAYIDWVVENPAMTRFLFGMRHAPFLDTEEATIATLNSETLARAATWIADRVDAGELPAIDPSLRWALIFGPCRHWAGSWLRGTTPVKPEEAKRQIAAAAGEEHHVRVADADASDDRFKRAGLMLVTVSLAVEALRGLTRQLYGELLLERRGQGRHMQIGLAVVMHQNRGVQLLTSPHIPLQCGHVIGVARGDPHQALDIARTVHVGGAGRDQRRLRALPGLAVVGMYR
jgi:AcrR family transcriptional regulator